MPLKDLRKANQAMRDILETDPEAKPESECEKYQEAIFSLVGVMGNDSYHKICLDLDIEMDTGEDTPFLLCPFNRYSPETYLFRSPWSYQYFPEEKKGEDFKELFGEAYQEIVSLEKRANEMFNFYAELYHNGQEGLATSFYIIDYESDELIEGIFLLKKTTDTSAWNTFHHFKIALKKDRTTFTCYSGVYAKVTINGCQI
jgi:hypothetical protein